MVIIMMGSVRVRRDCGYPSREALCYFCSIVFVHSILVPPLKENFGGLVGIDACIVPGFLFLAHVLLLCNLSIGCVFLLHVFVVNCYIE